MCVGVGTPSAGGRLCLREVSPSHDRVYVPVIVSQSRAVSFTNRCRIFMNGSSAASQ